MMANFYEDLAGEVGSDVGSEVSDVNPAEMAKMLQDLDDMDSALFNSKKQNLSSSESLKTTKKGKIAQDHLAISGKPHFSVNTSKAEVSEKKPQIKKTKDSDFDWDDPLADILSSDESVSKNKPVSSNPRIRKSITQSDTQEESDGKGIWKEKEQKGKLVADLFALDDRNINDPKQQKQDVSLNNASLIKISEKPKSLESTLENISNQRDKNSGVKSQGNLVSTTKSSANKQISNQKDEMTESDDILIGLGLENDKKTDHFFDSTSVGLKAKSLTDDVLFSQDIHRSSVDAKKVVAKDEGNEEGLLSFGSYAPSLTTNRESRRAVPKRDTSSIGDPLGLFTPPVTPSKNPTSLSSQKQTSDLKTSTPMKKSALNDGKSDWLGLSTSKDDGTMSSSSPERRRQVTVIENKPPPVEYTRRMSVPQQAPDDLPEWLGGKGTHAKIRKEDTKQQVVSPEIELVQQNVHSLLPHEQGLTLQTHTQMDQEAAYALQLQEQQLLTAVHMRQHEAQMASIHERQRALIQQQESQMKQLLTQQTQRQQQLEQQLQIQQKRIADYMQVLVSQPPLLVPTLSPLIAPSVDPSAVASTSVPMGKTQQTKEDKVQDLGEDYSERDGTKKEIKVQITELQVALQQCELEKKALETTLENLQSKHKQELHLLEECYKRQITILEEAMEKHTMRLKTENERIEADYKDHLSKLQEQQLSLIESHSQQMAALQKDHIIDMQALKDQHNELLKHVRLVYHAETSAVKEASQNITVLQTTVEQLGKNTDNLSEMQMWLDKQSNSQNELRELSLKTKEAEIQAYKENLLRQREAAEEERRKLLGLVEQLELQITQQRSKAEEERFCLRQDTARLDARIEAFEREREYAKTELERERQHVEKARQTLLQEQKSVTLQFKEEKMALTQERARIQALTQLHGAATASQEQVMQLKAEAEAALAVAKEATEQVDVQRAAILEQQKQIDKERQRLQGMEHTLVVRARELEALSQTALTTRNEGADALANASQLEERQKQRATDLQRQLNEIREREQRISEERALLSQERMKIHRNRDQKVCAMCKGSLKKPNHSEEPSLMTSSEATKYVDPKLVILKLVAEKERDVLLSTSLNLSAPK